MAVKRKESKSAANTIKCPYCGKEYKSEEIFLIHNKKSEITLNLNPMMEEVYECDQCEQSFITTINFKFNVKAINEFVIQKKNMIKLELI